MKQRLVHEFISIPAQRSPRRIFLDGIYHRLVIFGCRNVPSPNVFVDSALLSFSSTEVPTVYEWPVVRDATGVAIQYETFVDITDDAGTNDPIAMLHTIRIVERP